jgi:hypothetical protein
MSGVAVVNMIGQNNNASVVNVKPGTYTVSVEYCEELPNGNS